MPDNKDQARLGQLRSFAFVNGRPVRIDEGSGLEIAIDAAGARVEVPAHSTVGISIAQMMGRSEIQSICDGKGAGLIRQYVALKDKWAAKAMPGSASLAFEGLRSMLDQAHSMEQPEADFLSFLMLLFIKSGVVTCPGHDRSIVPDPMGMALFVFPTIRAIAAKGPEAEVMEPWVRDGLDSLMSEQNKPLSERKYVSLARHVCVQNALRPGSPGPIGRDEVELLRQCVLKQCEEEDAEAIEYKAEDLVGAHKVFKKDLKEAERCYRQLISLSPNGAIASRFYWRLSRLYSTRGLKDEARSWKCLSAAMVYSDGFALCDFAQKFAGSPDPHTERAFSGEAMTRALSDGLREYASGDYDNNLAGAAYLVSKHIESEALAASGKLAIGKWKVAFANALLASWALRLRMRDSPNPDDSTLYGNVMQQLLECRQRSGCLEPMLEIALTASDIRLLLAYALISQEGRAMTAVMLDASGGPSWLCLRWERRKGEEAAPAIITASPHGWYAGAQQVLMLSAEGGRIATDDPSDRAVVSFDEIRGTELYCRGRKVGALEGEFTMIVTQTDEWLDPGDRADGQDDGNEGGGQGGPGGGDGGDAIEGVDDGAPFSIPSGEVLQ